MLKEKHKLKILNKFKKENIAWIGYNKLDKKNKDMIK